ncbi:carbamoyl-phosphate synthase large subunit [Candidatus Vidania fulgoroideorum]
MLKNILVIGAGPIVIGQACEFDYSGVQACKVLRNMNYNVVLINNNPATVMTDMVKNTIIYTEPVNILNITRIIKNESIDAILPNVGGQVGLNMVLKLSELGKLKKYKVKLLGTGVDSIINSENRDKFRKLLISEGIPVPRSFIIKNVNDGIKKRRKLISNNKNNLVIVRTSYSLGGSGGGIYKSKISFIDALKRNFNLSKNKEIIIEESLLGNKEFELEILVDKYKNFLVVCSLENIDKVGVHTGDSVVISPIQTLTNYEYQKIRSITRKVINLLNIKSSGANIQFSVNPKTGEVSVIEVNPRVSRSSALASKATGYPIAKVSTVLSLGIPFYNINFKISGRFPCFYEPTIDYFVLKVPKFCNEKFGCFGEKLGPEMKSTGESMAIGRSLEGTMQNAFRGLEFEGEGFLMKSEDLDEVINNYDSSNENRYNCIFEAMKLGIIKSKDLDFYFLNSIRKISNIDNTISKNNFKLSETNIRYLKFNGFTDSHISKLINKKDDFITNLRIKKKVYPNYKYVDTCSCEFKTNSSYIYPSYLGRNEVKLSKKDSYIIIGSGPNRIGQGIEFDYCCVHASVAIRKIGLESVIINCNPETVSTDYDVSNRLYISPICIENILNLYKFESSKSVIVQFCGQLKLSELGKLKKYKVKLLGTGVDSIINSENRDKFRKLLISEGIPVPRSFIIKNVNDGNISKKHFPLIIRPSYVLSGDGMKMIKNKKSLKKFLVSKRINKYMYPLIAEEFLKNSSEYDIDFIVTKKKIFQLPLLRHLEPLGIHSGDSNMYINLSTSKYEDKFIKTCKRIISKIKILGFCNIQLAKNRKNNFYLIEINPRASRTVPFISKSMCFDCVEFCIVNLIKKNRNVRCIKYKIPNYVFLKTPIFSFYKFKKTDPMLGPEMKSTGESMAIGRSLRESFSKSVFLTDKTIKRILFLTDFKLINFTLLKTIELISNTRIKNIYSNISISNKNKILKNNYKSYNLREGDACVMLLNNNESFMDQRIKLQSNRINIFFNLENIFMFSKCLNEKNKRKELFKSVNKVFNRY